MPAHGGGQTITLSGFRLAYTNRMRISLVSLHTSPFEVPGRRDAGGMNVVVRETALALARRGHSVTVFTRASAVTPPGTTSVNRDVTLVALPAGDPALRKEDLPQTVPQFSERLRRHDAFTSSDVVHAHYWLSGLAALPGTEATGTPLFSTLHTVATQKNVYGGAEEPDARIAGEQRLVDRTVIMTGSASELEGIREGYGPPALGAHIVRPGVDTELFHPAPPTSHPTASSHDETLELLVLGRIQPLKGQDLALEAFRVWRERGGRGRLTIAGEPTPDATDFYRRLREQAKPLGDSVRFLPAQSRERAAHLLRHHDLVLVPSQTETFGLVALEAAASGTPVLAARTTGLTESVADGVSGLLVESRDPSTWAAALMGLEHDPETLSRLARSARAHAESHSWTEYADQLIRMYSDYATFG